MKNAKINFSIDPEKPGLLRVAFSGKLTVDNASAFREQLMKNIEKHDSFVIETQQVEAFDLSFYQLMLSLRKYLEEQNKEYRFNMPLPAENILLLKQAGLETRLA